MLSAYKRLFDLSAVDHSLGFSALVQYWHRHWPHNTAIFLSFFAAIIALIPVALARVWPVRMEFWIAAGLLASFSAGAYISKRAFRRKLAKIERRYGLGVEDRLATIEKHLDAPQAAHTKIMNDRLAKLEADLENIKSEAVALDLVSALRAMTPLRSRGTTAEILKGHSEVEHGHALLMTVLIDDERSQPGTLAGRCLIEIGTTRERTLAQGSTEKLAIFTSLLGMRFVSVDVDPLNSKRASKILRYLNPEAKAVTARGENYLERENGPFDFIYLDAFDCDHGKHSQKRQDRYRELLQTDINDEACWKMHEACAQAINAKMRVGGIVVLDDTWMDADGQYAGKGKLALPLLLANGFEIIAKTRMTVALRRKAAGASKSAAEQQDVFEDAAET
ncbi:MAG TPA: hypothetical protein VHE09_11960 [Rhizomicrobium sp.]|nr:hypothetical protein [Rhizomicrobium sp.]